MNQSLGERGKLFAALLALGVWIALFGAAANAGIFSAKKQRPPVLPAVPAPTPAVSEAEASSAEEAQFEEFRLTTPAADLALGRENDRKAESLARYYEGLVYEDNAEIDKALEAYQKVLATDPG